MLPNLLLNVDLPGDSVSLRGRRFPFPSPSRLDLGARCISKVSQLMVLTRGIAQQMRWGRCILDHMMVYRSDDGAAPARA